MINPFAAIKALFTAKRTVEEVSREATQMNGTTPGWKTSEFWMHAATQTVTLWAAVQGFIPAKYAVIISAVGTGIYTICRTAYKTYTEIKSTGPVAQVDAQTVVVNK